MKVGAGAAALLAVAGMTTLALSSGPAGAAVNQFGVEDPGLARESASAQAAELAAMKAAGITAIRLDANWNWVQPRGPNSHRWRWLDRVVASSRAAGMSVDLIVDGCPQWEAVRGAQAPNAQPASPAVYARYAAALAARYAPRGVRTFEIGNEENNALFWRPAPNPAAYTADLIAAYDAIKRVAPSAVVLSGGFSPATNNGTNISPITFLQAMYAHGAKNHFDGVAIHPYSFPALPNTYKYWSAWSQMDRTNPSIRSVMIANGDGGKKIYITEIGAPTGGPRRVSETAQAAVLTQAIDAAKRTSWIGGIYLYTWRDRGGDTGNSQDWFGLLTRAGGHKPAYTAVKNAIG